MTYSHSTLTLILNLTKIKQAIQLKQEKDRIMKALARSQLQTLNETNRQTDISQETSNSNLQSSSHRHDGNRNIVKWMSKTVFSSTELMHPQHRNAHGSVFGGYIMKQVSE